MFLVTAKIGSPNKQNSMIFRTEIGLKVIFGANCSTCIEIVQYLRPKTKQYCHTKTLIGFVLLCTRLTVYGSQKKKKSFGGFYREKLVGETKIAHLMLLSIHLVKAPNYSVNEVGHITKPVSSILLHDIKTVVSW